LAWESNQIETGLGLGDSRGEIYPGLEFLHGWNRAVFQERDRIGGLAEGSAFSGGAEIDDDFLAPFQEVEDVVEGMVPWIFLLRPARKLLG